GSARAAAAVFAAVLVQAVGLAAGVDGFRHALEVVVADVADATGSAGAATVVGAALLVRTGGNARQIASLALPVVVAGVADAADAAGTSTSVIAAVLVQAIGDAGVIDLLGLAFPVVAAVLADATGSAGAAAAVFPADLVGAVGNAVAAPHIVPPRRVVPARHRHGGLRVVYLAAAHSHQKIGDQAREQGRPEKPERCCLRHGNTSVSWQPFSLERHTMRRRGSFATMRTKRQLLRAEKDRRVSGVKGQDVLETKEVQVGTHYIVNARLCLKLKSSV
ncbi:MAG: hypothetical protein WC604_02000, partial [Candidatus Gracilibacteria bacterium]